MTTPPTHYDRRTVTLHWLTAALVIALWTLGQTIDWFPKGTLRVYARSTHIALGAALAVVLIVRLQWRLSSRATHLPAADAGWLGKVATFVHGALYALLIATVALGVANTWVRGDSLYDLVKITPFRADDHDLRETVEDLHGLAANVLLFTAAGHALAALAHHYLRKDAVLRRMWPRG